MEDKHLCTTKLKFEGLETIEFYKDGDKLIIKTGNGTENYIVLDKTQISILIEFIQP